jgi:hypothetical protein
MIGKTQRSARSAYSIFIATVCQGTVPAWHDETGYPVVYKTELEAQREIADHHLTLIEEFLAGERDFDDAMTVEDIILPVDVWPDGSISIEDGTRFGKQS